MSSYLLPPGFGARKKASKGLEGKDLGLAAVLAAAVVLIDQATGEHLYRTFSKIMDWLEGARDARQALKEEIARLEASLRNAEMRERQDIELAIMDAGEKLEALDRAEERVRERQSGLRDLEGGQ